MSNERMNRSNPAITLLFWTMFVVGGLSLAVGMILPVWLEYRVEISRRDEAYQRLEDVKKQLVALERRIDHLQNDPAYLERVASREFGFGAPPTEDAVAVQVVEAPATSPVLLEAQRPADRVVAVIDEATQTHPLIRLYLLDETRPLVMGMSAGLLAAAILLLGRNTARPIPPERAPQ
jgi:hypothetical protein